MPISFGSDSEPHAGWMAYPLLNGQVWDESANIATRHLSIHRIGLLAKSQASSCLISSFAIAAMSRLRNSDCTRKRSRARTFQNTSFDTESRKQSQLRPVSLSQHLREIIISSRVDFPEIPAISGKLGILVVIAPCYILAPLPRSLVTLHSKGSGANLPITIDSA